MADGLPRMRIREGCRGGSEQFSWNITKKEDFKDREQYLGISTKVGLMGKFGRYYVHDWYAKSRETTSTINEEKDAVKAYEEELMAEALGQKPKKLLLARKQLTEQEMKQLLKKDSDIPDEQKGRAQMGGQKKIFTNKDGEQVEASNEDLVYEGSKDAPIKGLGFASHRTARLEAIKAATMGTKGELEGTSASSFLKKEEIKTEVKSEIKSEAFMDQDSFTLGGKTEPKKEEVKQEEGQEAKSPKSEGAGQKRPREEVKEEKDRGKAEKKDKDEKKRKKAEKKLKKLAKKEKKALKKEKKAEKAAKKAAKKTKKASSSSSSGSS